MGEAVRLVEVSPRDGLQNEPEVLRLDQKVGLVQRLVAAGFKDIEVGSFVSPRWVPQMADTDALFGQLQDVPDDVRLWALVPNPIGLDRALDVGVRNVCTFLSASESHNRKNVNRSVRESLAGLRKVIGSAKGSGLRVRSYVSTAFGCPYEGAVSPDRVLELAKGLIEFGADEIAFGDTIGSGEPEQVKALIGSAVSAGIPLERIACHFHDTRGTALANVYAAWQEGVRCFDGSIAGIGGCPYAPGASGNAATEDVLHLLDRMGASSGVDLERACEAGGYLRDVLGRPLPGRYHQYWWGRQQSADACVRSA